jgi:hypothetical protein
MLSGLTGKDVQLGRKAVATSGPSTCPACGSANVMWGCDPEQLRDTDEIHPLV